MDKTEYQERLEELQELLRIKDYKAAYELVNGIDWRKVKSTRTLSMVADVYEVNKDYERCRQVKAFFTDLRKYVLNKET